MQGEDLLGNLLLPHDSMQTFRRDCTYLVASHSFSISLLATVFWTPASGICKTEELTAFTTDRNMYVSQWNPSNGTCKVLVKAAYDADVVKITIKEANLGLRGPQGACTDIVTFYDGSSTMVSVLGEFCGRETPTYESTGNTVLMTFVIYNEKSRIRKSFKMEYFSIDRGGYEAYKSSKPISVGAIIGIVVAAVLLNLVLFVFVYRKCKNFHRTRQNVNNVDAVPADLGMTTLTLLEQPNNKAVTQKPKVSNGHQKFEGKSSKTIDLKVGCNGNGQKKQARVRHPAGDLKCGELPHPPLHINTYIIHEDGCSGYSSELEESGCMNDWPPGVEHHYIHINNSLLAQDPSGVFYAGSIDEEGVLHPPGNQCYPVYATASAPVMVSSVHSQNPVSQLQEEDRRSRSSLHSRRSPFLCGRESPSSGRGSPFQNRASSTSRLHCGSPRFPSGFLELEGHTLTYYGMIDGDGSSGGDAPPYPGLSINGACKEEGGLSAPPPSYEDAATGKYSPKFRKQ